MPYTLEVCRICMSVNIKMFKLINTNMESLYYLLTQVYVDTEDGKPTTVCFLCYARLQQCDRLQQQAIKSNELLEQLLKDELMQVTTNANLNSQYSSQDLQVSSTYHLDLEPINCADVLLDPKVEANYLISVKEEAIDEECNATENAIINGQYSSQDLQVSSTYASNKPANCADVLLDPKVEANNLISVKEEVEAIDKGCNVTENLSKIQQNKGIRNYPHPSNLIQILKGDKTSHNNEIDTESTRNLGKKKGTLITNEQNAEVDGKSAKIWEETKTNLVSNKQKNHDKDTQGENINNPQKSVNAIIGDFQCNECSKQFSTKNFLTDHKLKCIKTTETSLSDSQLTKEDTVKSLMSEMYSCDICTFKTKRKLSIVTHLKMHNVTKVLSCNICEYKCIHKRNLTDHMRTHTGEKPFSCDICEYKFALKPHLIRHRKTHTGEKPFSCNICEYRCSHKYNLKDHMRTHTGEKPFSCNICEYRSTRKHYLQVHMRTHTGEKPYSCTICEYRCSLKSNLKHHMGTHTGEKPFSCNICEYRCAHNSDLKRHIRTHTGEKPFSCKICVFKCSQKHHLKDHMRTHTGEKPFSCNICEFRCSHNCDLIKHIRKHTGEIPYSCNICDYKSTRKDRLKSHLRTHN